MHLYTYLALDLANERTRDAREQRRAMHLADARPSRPSFVRRGLAQGLAAVSRGSAAAARRLDAMTADDLGTLSATE
jgi:hypothetical protein